MEITIVAENFAYTPNVIAEYGLSLHIRDNSTQILLDTGQGEALLPNASVLGIDLQEMDHLVLSHGHFDHTGGLSRFLLRSRNIPIWAHPDIEAEHTRLLNGKARFIGCHLNRNAVDLKPVTALTAITDNVWAIEVPLEHRNPDFLNRPEHLVIPGEKGWELDPFTDDISLVVKGEKGFSILLGCAHAGVVNILEEAAAYFHTREFHAVIGGMHIGDQSPEFIDRITTELTTGFKVKKWRPCHCSGFRAAYSLANKAEDVFWGGTGIKLEI